MLGRWVTSNPSRPSVSSTPCSVCCRSSLRSGGTQPAHQSLEGQKVALRAEPGNHSDCEIGDDRMPSFRLSCEDIRQVQFNERNLYRQQGIAKGETGMSQSSCVDQRTIDPPAQPLNGFHHRPFMIGLEPIELDTIGARS